jgi:hypothetical protein
MAMGILRAQTDSLGSKGCTGQMLGGNMAGTKDAWWCRLPEAMHPHRGFAHRCAHEPWCCGAPRAGVQGCDC